MNFFRRIYFNKLVNKLNKNLKIKQKSYLSFLLVSIMILFFSIYVLYSYSEIKKREVFTQEVYSLNHNYLSLIILLEQQYSLLNMNTSEKNSIKDKQILNAINALNKSILLIKNGELDVINLQKLLNTVNNIESLSIFEKGYSSSFLLANESKQIQEKDKIKEIIYELLSFNDKFVRFNAQVTEQSELIFNRKNILIYIFLGIGLLGCVIIANFISYRITDPIEKLKDNIQILEQGNYNLDINLKELDNDEIGDIANGIERIGHTIKETVIFTYKIGKNEFDTDLNLNKSGKLASALLSMRDSLKVITEQNEIQKLQEEKRTWVIKGLADLGNILRSNFYDLNSLYFDILKTIINYIGANQGGLFIIQEKDSKRILQLSSCYAYDRRKFITKELEIGEGLVGRCAQEKLTTNLTEIPENYINISSGLGKSNPRNLILIPLILNDEIYGVIELASFKFFDEHQIEYLEKSAESIASTISSMQINITTKALLEKTQIQAEDIASREEEMRQNIEELKATQEEYQRKIDQLEQLLAESKSKENKV